VKPTGNEAIFSTSTGKDGEFTIPNLATGSYLITADQLGFNKVYKNVNLTAGQTTDIPLTLSLNVVTQSVTVSAQIAASPKPRRPRRLPL
jgi:hypothetical protein